MKIDLFPVAVKDLYTGYEDRGDDGVVGYGGMLDIRPPYQREFVYNAKQSEEVIHTILKGFPLNIMYWVNKGNGQYEVLDGQQRTLAICKFLHHDYSITVDGNKYYWDSLPDEYYDQLMNYQLMVYVCEGTNKEKREWFEIVNIAGEKLTNQELRNATYTGEWLSDAKRHFSKRNCVAYMMAKNYTSGDPNRQELLEKALKWICDTQSTTIDEYMSRHQHDKDADELWQYWQDIFNWVQKIFPNYRSLMKNQDWGTLYNRYHENAYNATALEKRIVELIDDDEVTSKKGIYPYLLSGEQKHLSLRAFDERDKRKKYQEQGGICPHCESAGIHGKVWKYNEMEGDHITPWSEGGKTEYSNLQMLCKTHNRMKGNK